MEIYISREGRRVGPFTLEEINHQLATGALTAADLGWSERNPGWKPVASLPGVIMPGGASSMAASTSIATPITWGLPTFAGFWIRSVAFVIDFIIITIFCLVIATVFKRSPNEWLSPSLFGSFLQFLLLIVYWPALWASRMEATAGQRMLRLRVVDGASSGGISFGQALQRTFGLMISGLLLGVGFIM